MVLEIRARLYSVFVSAYTPDCMCALTVLLSVSVKATALYGVGSEGIYWVRVNVSGDLEKLTLTSSKPCTH